MIEPVIIGCFPRSGSTLLRCILNAHPNIYAGPEIGFRIDQLIEEVSAMGKNANLTDQDVKELVRLQIENFYQVVCRRNDKTRWIDKSPNNVVISSYWKDIFPNSKFVIMVRDPRDNLASFKKLGFSKFLNAFWDGLPFDDEMKMLLVILKLFEVFKEEVESTLEIYGQDCLIVKYEDLIIDTEKTLRNLMEFIGEDWSDNLLHHQDFYNVIDYASGNKFGWVDEDTVQAVHNTNVGQWKDVLKGEELKLTSKRARITMDEMQFILDFPSIVERFGYSIE